MVLCFLGDSLTQGIGDTRALSWVGRLARCSFALDPKRVATQTICNLGLRGDSSSRIAARWREETDRRRRPGEDMAFVFSFGAADGLHSVPRAESLSNSRAIFETAVSLGTTLFISPPPAHDPDWSTAIRELGEQQRALCAELGVPSTDFYAPLAASAPYMASLAAGDGIHPDAAGYDEMAALLHGWQPLRAVMGL